MKLIFLDIDGVLNSERTALAYGRGHIDKTCVDLVNKLARDSWADVVVSSSHRQDFLGPSMRRDDLAIPCMVAELVDLEGLQRYMASLGLTARVIGATPSISVDRDAQPIVRRPLRGFEIKLWLSTHQPTDLYGYVIIDDLNVAHDDQREHFVRVNGEEGFGYKNTVEAVRILARGD